MKRTRTAGSLLRGLGLTTLLAYAGCVGTPVPQPPAHNPPDAAALDFDMTGSMPQFVGLVGAAEPDTTLRVTLLDRIEPPIEVDVAADGSFTVVLASGLSDGEELRLSVRSPAGRSLPVDVAAPVAAAVIRPSEGCFRVPLELEVPATGPAALVLDNRCNGMVQVDLLRLRTGADFTLSESGPLTLAPGATATVQVEVVSALEEVLFLDVSAPVIDRRVVSLIPVPDP